MRAALWLLALFGVAVAIALFAGNNQGTVTVFWPPYRVDLSLNLVLLLVFAAFVFLHAAFRALSALFDLPRQALRWRTQQKERAMHASLLDAISHLLAGRFIRARKSAQAALGQERSLGSGGQEVGNAVQVRTLAHLLAAESAQALQDRASREEHLKQALEQGASRDAQEAREGALMRAARWSLDDREPQAAMAWLKGLPQGAARRTLALRIKLKAARLAQRTPEALETARRPTGGRRRNRRWAASNRCLCSPAHLAQNPTFCGLVVCEVMPLAWFGTPSQPIPNQQAEYLNYLQAQSAIDPLEQMLRRGPKQAGIPLAIR